MKYEYAYKTSDGVRHVATITANSREEVFAALRKQGIRAIKVVAADGSKANGEVRGIRKRIVTLAVLLSAVLTGTIVYFSLRNDEPVAPKNLTIAKPLPRQEITGNRDRVNAAVRQFTEKADIFLAQFVEPGRPFVANESDWPSRAEFDAALSKPITYAESEPTEQIDVKRMLAYLKAEMAFYLKHGGYVSGYIKDLIRRQNMEIAERDKHLKKLNELLGKSSEKDAYNYWLKANAQLRVMGIYPLQMPNQLLHYSINSTID